MSKLKRLLRLSPCKVHFRWFKDNWAGGEYVRYDETTALPMIVINKGGSKNSRLIALVHEIGHALCEENDCGCYKDAVLGEYHALKFTLEYFLKNKNKKLLEKAMCGATAWLNDLSCHKEASEMMFASSGSLYDECLKFVLACKSM